MICTTYYRDSGLVRDYEMEQCCIVHVRQLLSQIFRPLDRWMMDCVFGELVPENKDHFQRLTQKDAASRNIHEL